MATPESGLELLVPTLSDVTIKYTWTINKYARSIKKRESFDSPPFEHNANGIRTRWNLSVRFWRGPDGKRVKNPVVLCLNLLSCAIDGQAQARVGFQFAVYNVEVNRWEQCHLTRIALNLENSTELLSVGHRDLSILGRHVSRPDGDVSMFVKIRLSPSEADENTLSRDLSNLLGGGDVSLRCDDGREIKAHSVLLRARSAVFAEMLDRSTDSSLAVEDLPSDLLLRVLRYVYTDHVEDLDTTASTLIAAADRFDLPGLKALCERSLVETISPESVASLLLVADRFNCETLKRTLLAYCEDNVTAVKKSMAWKVMELVNHDLFVEVCETGIGGSASSDLESLASDPGVTGL